MSCSVASGWCQWLSQLLQYSRDIPVSSLPSGYRKELQWKHWGEMENGKVWQVRVGVGGEQPAYPSVPHLTKRGRAGGGGQITHTLETQCQLSVMARGFLSLLATQPGASYPGNLEI